MHQHTKKPKWDSNKKRPSVPVFSLRLRLGGRDVATPCWVWLWALLPLNLSLKSSSCCCVIKVWHVRDLRVRLGKEDFWSHTLTPVDECQAVQFSLIWSRLHVLKQGGVFTGNLLLPKMCWFGVGWNVNKFNLVTFKAAAMFKMTIICLAENRKGFKKSCIWKIIKHRLV